MKEVAAGAPKLSQLLLLNSECCSTDFHRARVFESPSRDGMRVYLNRSRCVNLFCVLDDAKQATSAAARHFLRWQAEKACFASSDNLLLFHRDCRDFDAGIVDQGRCLGGLMRRLGVGHNSRNADDVLQF